MTASRLSDLTVDVQDFDDAVDDLTVHGKRMARGTEPLQEDVVPRMVAEAELQDVCTVLLELEALVTRCGGFMRMDDQQVLFRARQMLDKHGRRQTTEERASSVAHMAKVVTP